MIRIDYRAGAWLLTNTATSQQLTLSTTDAPALLAQLLADLGVQGSQFQQGYRAGYIAGEGDGRLEGYRQRDREYIISRAKERDRAAMLAVLALAEGADAA